MQNSSLSSSPSEQSSSWHHQSLSKILEKLQVKPDIGLTSDLIKQRSQTYGANEIKEGKGRSQWEILLDQFQDIMLLMLIAVAIISGVLDFVELRNGGLEPGSFPFKDT